MNLLPRGIIAAIVILGASLSTPVRAASSETEIKKVADTFYAEYLRSTKNPPKKDYDAHLIQWVNTSPYTSPAFKKALAKAVTDAHKKDPELGLDADPILAGQDYPEKGYRAGKIKVTNDKATVAMEGVGEQGFHISVEMINSNGHWLIDGIGRIKASGK